MNTFSLRWQLAILIGALHPQLGSAQSLGICPGTAPISPNNTLPRVIFPIAPVVGQPWYVCYQNPMPCNFSYPANPTGPNPEPHLVILPSTNGFDLKTQWIESSFGICPDTAYLGATMPVPAAIGPMTIRMFQRTASGIANLQFFPFVQTFEQVIQVQAAPISSVGVPGLDWRSMLGLSVLMIGVAGMYRRR